MTTPRSSDDLYGPGGPTTPSFGVRHRRGHNYPRLRCAGCGEWITDVKIAGIVWHPDTITEDGFSPIVVLCKMNDCLGRDPRWTHWWWQPLSHYLVWLLQNTGGHSPKKLRALIAEADEFAEMAG